ncbi:MAG: hypothetical protein GX640_22995, partial [Fibrobacter sp.]|nr:hypothetical protein [Fibrobacter sp.]
ILSLVPNSDTLWVVTGDGSGNEALCVIEGNGTLPQKLGDMGNWLSYSLRCKSEYGIIINLTRGGDGAVLATLFPSEVGKANPFLLLRTVNNTIRIEEEFSFPWSEDSVLQNNPDNYLAQSSVWINGYWYFACLDGGVVRWNSDNSKAELFFPGNSSIQAVETFEKTSSRPETMKQVTGVGRIGDTLVVTTPARCWFFSTSDSSWDSSIESSITDSDLKFSKLEYVVPYNNDLYAVISVKKKNSGADSYIFAKYIKSRRGWSCILEDDPNVISFAPGFVYIVTDTNNINVYEISDRDTVIRNPSPVVNSIQFNRRLAPLSYGIDYPQVIYDIQYVPRTDSTGYLWIATSEGLFFSEKEKPGVTEDSLLLIKRAPKIESGLKKTYARPGILTLSAYGNYETRTVFIYDLSKDAKVTIRVYDYNMDLVKTIISSRARKAGKNGGPHGRSTVESEDWWDGRVKSGKMASPGVYYYKITTDIGEHAFGKIVVAK